MFTCGMIGPEFHNGAAAGLRIGPASPSPLDIYHHKHHTSSYTTNPSDTSSTTYHPPGTDHTNNNDDDSSGMHVTRNWIIYNRTHAQTTQHLSPHAGLVLTLGLQGHLKALSMNDTCDYLTQGHELTTVAVLLGMYYIKFVCFIVFIRMLINKHIIFLVYL